MYYFVFFKQKTAYEMRISEWSSDVCSSDLVQAPYFIDVTAVAGTVVTLGIERILSRFADVAEHARRPFQADLAALPAWHHHAGLRINDFQRVAWQRLAGTAGVFFDRGVGGVRGSGGHRLGGVEGTRDRQSKCLHLS